jgi:hypothetical protein
MVAGGDDSGAERIANGKNRGPVGNHHAQQPHDGSTDIGREALILNPALRPLAFLIGTWHTAGSHPKVPDRTFHGRTSFAWHQGGAFLISHSEIDEPEVPSGVAIFGSDNVAKQLFMIYFDERGVSRKYDVTVRENEMTWRRDNPEFSQWSTTRAEPGGDRMTSTGQMSEKGGPWQDDLSLTYVRADPA